MATVSVTSKGQVTIPKRVRRALGITPGSKVEFDIDRDGPPILNYSGPRIPIDRMHGGLAMRKAVKRARR